MTPRPASCRPAKRVRTSPPAEQQQQKDETPLPLLDLPDACLHHLVSLCSPMDRRLLARTCRRLRDLASSSDLHLLLVSGASTRAAAAANVVSCAEAEGSNGSGRQRRFSSLAAAVAASEAGDTIVCGPGRHCLQRPLVVQHALHILGAGESETVLEGPAGGHAVIEFRASGRLGGLAVVSSYGDCIRHTSGSLRIESCHLVCNGGGLGTIGIVAPLVASYARGPLDQLLVSATRISSGDRTCLAVRLERSARLSAVRVFGSGVFYFEVHGTPVAALPAAVAVAAATAPSPASMPAWAGIVDAQRLEAQLCSSKEPRCGTEAASTAPAPAEPCTPASAALEQKACAWACQRSAD